MRIALKINGKPIDLDEKSKVTLTVANPAFDEVLVQRAYSFPFTIPATGNNLHVLRHINRLDAVYADGLVLEATLSVGESLFVGAVTIGTIRSRRIEITFKNLERNYAEEFGKVRLSDVLGVVEIPTPNIPEHNFRIRPGFNPGIGGGTPITYPYNQPIYINGTPYNLVVSATGVNLGDWLDLVDAINLDYPNVAEYILPDGILRLRPGYTYPDFNIVFNQGFWLWETMPRLPLVVARGGNFNTWIDGLIANPIPELSFPMHHAPLFCTERGASKNPLYDGYVNLNRDGDYLISEATNEGIRYMKTPFVRLSHILASISDFFGFGGWAIDQYTEGELYELLIYNNVTIDAQGKAYFIPWVDPSSNGFEFTQQGVDSIDGTYYTFYADKITLSDHLPDMTVYDFVKAVGAVFNARIDTTRNVLHFVPKVEQLLTSESDMTRFVTDEYEVQPQSGSYFLRFAEDKEDSYIPAPTPVQLDSVGTGTTAVEVPRPLYDTEVNSRKFGNLRMAVTNRAAKSTTIGVNGARIDKLRLVWGTTTIPYSVGLSGNAPIYHATHLETDITGTIAVHPFPLELSDRVETGIYNRYYKEWMPILRARDVTFYLFMPKNRISVLEQWIKSRFLLKLPMGQVICLPKTIEMSEGIGVQELLKVEAVVIANASDGEGYGYRRE